MDMRYKVNRQLLNIGYLILDRPTMMTLHRRYVSVIGAPRAEHKVIYIEVTPIPTR
jgi:hypothetical protein